MIRRDYIQEIKTKLYKLGEEDMEEAVSYFEEILDERQVGENDQVPEDMPSPRQASFEILRDISIEEMEDEDNRKTEKKKPSLFTIVILSILALPLAFPLAIVAILLVLLLILSFIAVDFSIFMIGIYATGMGGYRIIFELPRNFELANLLFLLGFILVGIALIILSIILIKWGIDLVKKILMQNKNKRS